MIGRAGTDVIVAGSALYRAADMAAEVERIRSIGRRGPRRRQPGLTGRLMRALLQRVSRAEVRVDGATVGSIGPGLLVLLGVGHGDDEATADALARRICELRIFEDDEGRTNRSLLDVDGEALVVSQFTLYADTQPRPSPRVHRRRHAGPRPRALAAGRRGHGGPGRADRAGRVRGEDGGRARQRRAVHDLARHGGPVGRLCRRGLPVAGTPVRWTLRSRGASPLAQRVSGWVTHRSGDAQRAMSTENRLLARDSVRRASTWMNGPSGRSLGERREPDADWRRATGEERGGRGHERGAPRRRRAGADTKNRPRRSRPASACDPGIEASGRSWSWSDGSACRRAPSRCRRSSRASS